MKPSAVVIAITAILIRTASGSTVPPDAPNQPPFSLSSLQEHCDDQTGAAIVASLGSEYHFTLRPRSEINLPSQIPLTIGIAYQGGALTCYPAIIPPDGSTRPQIAAQVGVVMEMQFLTAGGAFNEQFGTEIRGRGGGGLTFEYSTTPGKLQGTYRPDLPNYSDVGIGFVGYFGGDLTNGEVVEFGIPPGHVSELIPVAEWAAYLDHTPVPTSTPVQTPTAPSFLPPTPCPSDAPCPPNTFRDCSDPASCTCLCEAFTPALTPTPTPLPGFCGDSCDDHQKCIGHCPGWFLTGGLCSYRTPTGCGCVAECPTPPQTPTGTIAPCHCNCPSLPGAVVSECLPDGVCVCCVDGGCVRGARVETPTPRSTPSEPAILLPVVTARPGAAVQVAVTLFSAGARIVSTDNEFAVEALYMHIAKTQEGIPNCTVNPAIHTEASTFDFPPASAQIMRVHAKVVSGKNSDVIADGAVLYTCRVDISATAMPGTYPLYAIFVTDPTVTLSSGEEVRVRGVQGAVVVNAAVLSPTPTPTAPLFLAPTPCPSDAPCPPNTFRDCRDPASCACLCETFTPAPTPTPTPSPAALSCAGDCNGDGLVTIGDLITMVNVVLGNTPVNVCPQLVYCEATCLPEIIAGVNNALRGCPTTPPTLSLSVHLARNPATQTLQAVADLRNSGEVPVSYLTGCSARCRPKVYRAIWFQLIGPHDTEVMTLANVAVVPKRRWNPASTKSPPGFSTRRISATRGRSRTTSRPARSSLGREAEQCVRRIVRTRRC